MDFAKANIFNNATCNSYASLIIYFQTLGRAVIVNGVYVYVLDYVVKQVDLY